jgi:thiol-disulfide isomerase/thioredoxin
MRVFLFLMMVFLLGSGAVAQQSYEIKARIHPYKDGYLFLAYHFGSKQYLIDSAKIGAGGEAVFSGEKKLQGGIYMIVFPQKNGWVECMVDQQQHFTVMADTADLVGSLRYEGSSDNTLFGEYQKKSVEIGKEMASLREKMTGKPGDPEYDAANARSIQLGQEMQSYREQLQRNHSGHLLSAIFGLLKEPEIPSAEKHPKGKYDSTFAYQFYKDHYWDGIRLTDERLIRTPVLQGRFDRYFDQVLPQMSDSLIRYADQILAGARSNEEMFKFFLSSLTDKYVNPKYMGQDAVFVHLFEKYYLAGAADSWMNEKYRKFIFDRGYSLMMNVIGKKAAELPMVDTLGRSFSLYALQGPFTVVCFWDPTCGHCKEEVPRVDSIFQAKWKKQGVKLVGVMTDGGKDNWLKYIRENKLKDWVHVYQTDQTKDRIYKEGKPSYRQLYDVYQTPMIYLLDKDKNIVAKKLTYLQVDEFMEAKRNAQK